MTQEARTNFTLLDLPQTEESTGAKEELNIIMSLMSMLAKKAGIDSKEEIIIKMYYGLSKAYNDVHGELKNKSKKDFLSGLAGMINLGMGGSFVGDVDWEYIESKVGKIEE
jgi:hypothetical protein